MFKKRALQVKMVKTNDRDEQLNSCEHLDPERIDILIKDQVKHAAVAVITVIAAATIMHTLSEIAINASKSKNED